MSRRRRSPPPQLVAEYARLEQQLADPAVHADQAVARRLGRRYAELTPVVRTAEALRGTRGDLAAARELAAEDPGFAEEAAQPRRPGRRSWRPSWPSCWPRATPMTPRT